MDRGQTWEKIKERKEAKLKMESARSERLKHRRRQEYNAKNNEVKQSAREDKRNWMEGKAAAAEKAAENGRNKELYNITKTLAGEWRRQEVGVKTSKGSSRQKHKNACRDGWNTLVKH